MRSFQGPAFVAFADLCGFRDMVGETQTAYEALDRLYNKTYDLCEGHRAVSGLAVSDCVVAWVAAREESLDILLTYLRELHSHMLGGSFLMRTTVAKGSFRYQRRINLQNLEKGMMYGDAYLAAYLSNGKAEVGGITLLQHEDLADPARFAPRHAQFIQHQLRAGDRQDWEFYWSVRDVREIESLQRSRRDSYRARFAPLVRAYRGEFVEGTGYARPVGGT